MAKRKSVPSKKNEVESGMGATKENEESEKRQKTAATDEATTTNIPDDQTKLPLLPEDVMAVILSMLQPRETLSLASTSKFLMELVTHEHVIRGGVVLQKLRIPKVIAGTNTTPNTTTMYKELDDIVNLIKARAIFIPSPMRMLRLLLGTRCERCVTAPCLMQHGIYMCSNCIRETAFRYWGPPPRLPIRGPWDGSISRPYTSRGNGERCGPLVTVRDMTDMAWNGTTIEEFLETLPGCPNDAAIQSILDMHKEALESYKCIDEERERKKREAEAAIEEKKRKVQANREAKANRKRASIIEVISQVSELIDPRCRTRAMDYTWDDCFTNRFTSSSYPEFVHAFVQERLSPLVKAPSRATKTKISRLAEEINDNFQTTLKRDDDSSFDDASDEEIFQEPEVAQPARMPTRMPARMSRVFDSSDDDESDSPPQLATISAKKAWDTIFRAFDSCDDDESVSPPPRPATMSCAFDSSDDDESVSPPPRPRLPLATRSAKMVLPDSPLPEVIDLLGDEDSTDEEEDDEDDEASMRGAKVARRRDSVDHDSCSKNDQESVLRHQAALALSAIRDLASDDDAKPPARGTQRQDVGNNDDLLLDDSSDEESVRTVEGDRERQCMDDVDYAHVFDFSDNDDDEADDDGVARLPPNESRDDEERTRYGCKPRDIFCPSPSTSIDPKYLAMIGRSREIDH